MLSAVTRRQPRLVIRLYSASRSLSTDSTSSTTEPSPPLPPVTKHPSKPRPSRLYPQPRPAKSHRHQTLPLLPPTFGRNQLLPVSNSTRALLESIVEEFEAPIRYAFAYGSGVFEQDGYPTQSPKDKDGPMLDFMFAVTHPSHWHYINIQQHPSHYPFHARLLGSSFVEKIEEINPGVWFNTFVNMKGVTIKYGVTTVDNLCSDLLNWRTLYLAGRMHKPIRIIKDDARVRLTQQVNLTSAVRAALLTLPPEFSEGQLFERIAGISYSGDPRMFLPAENRDKVGNIVRKQAPQFKELYHRLVVALPGVHWPSSSSTIQQDTSPNARSAHVKKLPSNLLSHVQQHYAASSSVPDPEDSTYWQKLSSADDFPQVIAKEMRRIIWYPATAQTFKGFISAGMGKSIRYGSEKVSKWWNSSSSQKKPNETRP